MTTSLLPYTLGTLWILRHSREEPEYGQCVLVILDMEKASAAASEAGHQAEADGQAGLLPFLAVRSQSYGN